MDRYGYVSNQYNGHAMGGQSRVMMQGGGGGGCAPCGNYQQRQPRVQQPMCNYQGPRQMPIMQQPQPMMPEKDSLKQVFSQDGRDWTTGLCGCFEHCASCTSSYTHLSIRSLSAESSQHRTVSAAVLSPVVVCLSPVVTI